MNFWQFLISTHADGLLGYLAVILVISLLNLFWFRPIERYPVANKTPLVSVLIPARNEEKNIGDCLNTVLDQRYPNFEVWVLNDHSADGTAEIVRKHIQEGERVHLLDGKPLPSDWLGKHWACQQLAENSRGELLLFLDADTRLKPNAIAHAVNTFYHERLNLLSLVPREIVKSWGERLIQPFFLWAIFTVMPLGIAKKAQLKWLTFSIGQYMLFDRHAYFSIGGHTAVRNDVVDDIALGRRVVQLGFRWWLADGTNQVECRMYHSFRQVIEGFSKNFFAAFRYNLFTFAFVFLWLMVAFWEPLFVLLLHSLGYSVAYFPFTKAVWAVVLSLIVWVMVYARLKFPIYLAFFYPLTVLFNSLVALRSAVLTLKGKSTWKDRQLQKPKIRFF